MTTLSIIGPNLNDQSKATFHVHAAGCSDIGKYPNKLITTGEYASLADIVRDVYSDILDEGESNIDDLKSEFHVLPCALRALQ